MCVFRFYQMTVVTLLPSRPSQLEAEGPSVATHLRKRSRSRAGRAGSAAAAAAATCPCRGEGDGRRRACEKAARGENFQAASAFLLFQKRPASRSQKRGRILPSTGSRIQTRSCGSTVPLRGRGGRENTQN